MKLPLKNIIMFILTLVLMELALVWALGIAPADKAQGQIQRIFYFHMGSIWPGFIAFFYVMYGSIRYLISRNDEWDRRAHASGEVGLVFCTMVLTTGPIWAKPLWGVWWSWDARLTSTLVLWIIFLVYVNLRNYIDDESKRPRISAVLGIIGACMVPFVYFSIRLFNTQHPQAVIAGGEGSGIMDPNMRRALWLALTAFTFLYLFLWKMGREIFEAEFRMKRVQAGLNLLED